MSVPPACAAGGSPPAFARLDRARARLAREGAPRLALVVLPSPDYDVPTFNLSVAELAGYLRERRPELAGPALKLWEPDLVLARSPGLARAVPWTLERLRRDRPHLIGLSAKIGSQASLLDLLAALDEEPWARESLVVVGNVLATFSHEELSARHPSVLFALGDGELTLDALYGALDGEGPGISSGPGAAAGLPNLAYRTADGRVERTPRRMLDQASQHWLPALDGLDAALEAKADMTFRATAGCPEHCTYCSIKAVNVVTGADGRERAEGWRSYPPERTARLFAALQARGVRAVNLADDEFGNTDFGFLRRLAELLLAQRSRVSFNVSMRLDAFWHPRLAPAELAARREVLRLLRRAGLTQLFVGAESGSPSQLRRYGKGYPASVNTEALRVLLEEGVEPSVGFIPFDPLMTRRELEQDLAYLESEVAGRRVYELVASPLTVMRVQRGTPYERLLRGRGLLGPLESNLSFHRARFVDARLGLIGRLGQAWFREAMEWRYPVLQLKRMAAGNPAFPFGLGERAAAAVEAMHALDLRLVRAMLAAFPEDEHDRRLLGAAGADGTLGAVAAARPPESVMAVHPPRSAAASQPFLVRTPELARAEAAWLEAAEDAVNELDWIVSTFRRRRLGVEVEMRAVLRDAWGRGAREAAGESARVWAHAAAEDAARDGTLVSASAQASVPAVGAFPAGLTLQTA